MNFVTRRNFLKTTAAGLAAAPMLGRGAFAAEPLKVGFIFLGPIGDYGWTWAHNKGRLAMDAALKGQVVSSYVENVKEDASAVPILKDLAQTGSKLIFTTSYGYMDQTIEVAKQFPKVMFEHCTGYKHADNVGTYNSRFHQGRVGRGHDRGHAVEVGDDRLSRLLQGARGRARRERLHPGRPGGQPEDHDQARHDQFVVRSGQGSRRRADAHQPRLRRRRPAHRQPRRPSGVRAAQGLVLRPGRRHVALRAEDAGDRIEDIWGPYYISRAKAMLDGTWKPDDAWWGFKEGTVVMSPYNKALPDNVKAAADKIIAGWKDGSYDVFTGPIIGPVRQGARRQGAAHGGQGPRGHRLVRQGRAELRTPRSLAPHPERRARSHPLEGKGG